eukprot:TRINITY_DN54711_c0_g1_i1.p1 TRINITY_DN54711_c0_g1~~TRINITY_DN54711_c0_g1_i1.p1  ORF type:complete len:339 (-),score=101.37 TRINITY_DN54711_c0_g1_i1:79-1095(-)
MEASRDKLAKAQASGDLEAMRSALLEAKAAGADPAQINEALAELSKQEALARAAAAAPTAAPADAAAESVAKARASAEAYKKKGNEKLKTSTKSAAMDAMECFTLGLEVRCSDNVLNAQLYSNRAHVRMLLRQFVEAVDDCRKAIELDPKNMKAYWRAAKSSLHLDLYSNAFEFCEGGLQREPGDADLMKMKTVCAEKLAAQQRRKAEIATTQEFNADEAMALQERVSGLNEQCETLKRSIGMKKQTHIKTQITRKSLDEMSEDTSTYISVGRCFLKKEKAAVESVLASNVASLEAEIPKLTKSFEELEKRKEEAEKELKEMIQVFKAQTTSGASSSS